MRISEALAGVSQEMADLGLALDVARETSGRMQARAQAIEDLVAEGVLAGAGTEPVAPTPAEVDAELAELRRGLAGAADGS